MSGQLEQQIDVSEMLAGYKPPKPPKWKKSDVFDAEKVKDLDEKAKQVKITAETSFEMLAAELTTGLRNDLLKVRAVFTWMGTQDIEGGTYPDTNEEHKPLGVMKLIKTRKGTYAKLFALLCRAANVPCVMVRGNCKSKGYEVGDQDVSSLTVTWNAVFIDGSWQFVHPFWAFTAVTGFDTGRWTKIEAEGKSIREKAEASEGVTIRKIDEYYFLPPPEEIIYRCIAEKQEWQLIKHPWDLRKFCNVPLFKKNYFTSAYKLTSQHEAILLSVEGKGELEFTEKGVTTAMLTYELYFDEEQSGEKLPADIELPRTVFFETTGNKLRLLIRFHVVGIYKLSISAGYPLVEFRLDATEKSENQNMLPVNPRIGFGFGKTAKSRGLSAPSHTSGVVVTHRNTVETFTFRISQITEVLARLHHCRIDTDELDRYVTTTIARNNVSIKVTVPDDETDEEYALQVYAEQEIEQNNVVNYLLTTRKEDFENLNEKQKIRKAMQESRIRRNLTTAVLFNKTIGPLERSVTEFERAKLKDTDGYFRKAKGLLDHLKQEKQINAGMKDLRRTLKASMKDRNIAILENSISIAEKSGYRELDELVELAKDLVLELEQQEIDEAKASRVRQQLREATEKRNVKELEEAITEFQEADITDKGELRVAKKVLCRLYVEVVEEAMVQNDLDKLQSILTGMEKSVISTEVRHSVMIERSKRYLLQQRRINGCLRPIQQLNHSTVAEIKGYTNPRAITQDIMRASFILLGRHPKDVETWKKIQTYLKSSNDVLKKIKAVKKGSIHDNTIKWADQLLGKYTTDDVREVSAGVAAFYRWSNNMIQERST